jgi:hypothetical protein
VNSKGAFAVSGRAWKFTDAQATALADALERSPDDLARFPSRVPSTNLLEIFGGEDAEWFPMAMAAYCRRGGFEVT